MSSTPIDPNLAAQLLASSDKQEKEKVNKRKGLIVEPRTYEVWFKLHAKFGNCSNPDCTDPRERTVVEGNAMVCEVNGSPICRICFLAGVNPTLT